MTPSFLDELPLALKRLRCGVFQEDLIHCCQCEHFYDAVEYDCWCLQSVENPYCLGGGPADVREC